MKIIYPPKRITYRDEEYFDPDYNYKIFLAGTIDMGNSHDWQAEMIEYLSDHQKNLTFFNPRRPDWDNNIEQSLNDPRFYEQVSWELDMLKEADMIIMYLAEGSKSPISLMELGIFSGKKMIVYSPLKFYRKGNVDVVCEYFKIPYFEEVDKFKRYIRKTLDREMK